MLDCQLLLAESEAAEAAAGAALFLTLVIVNEYNAVMNDVAQNDIFMSRPFTARARTQERTPSIGAKLFKSLRNKCAKKN